MSAKSVIQAKPVTKDRLVDEAERVSDELVCVFRDTKDKGFINHSTILIGQLTTIMNQINLLP